jgi:outer membrane protein assembly factor BamB
MGTPALDAGRAYFLDNAAAVHLVALERTSGQLRWRASLGAAAGAPVGLRPAAIGDVVVAGGHDLIGFDARTGARRWIFAPPESYGFGFYLGSQANEVLFTGSGARNGADASRSAPALSTRLCSREKTSWPHTPILEGAAREGWCR